MSKKLYGIGINDVNYATRKTIELFSEGEKRRRITVWTCPFYRAWKDMFKRCYSKSHAERSKWFEGLLEAEEWILGGYSARTGNGWIDYVREGLPSVSFARYNNQIAGKDQFFQGMLDYLRNRDETKFH